ncbi:PEP/pyruvate-binding domain-containing protein, partial [Pseudomonadota bacterium]
MSNDQKIGPKTLKLKDLLSLGLNVPKFTFIDAETLKKVLSSKEELEKVSQKIGKELGAASYAVRSSSLNEDTENQSMAGQFKTELDVSTVDLPSAIKSVADDAGDIENFSILVQQYIDADFSGVAFTRNPSGGREMVIEYHKGIGEDVVSGKIVPEKILLTWNNPDYKSALPDFPDAITNIKKIENFYKFPQDIEWCIKDGKWYFLQTRPITTLSKDDYDQSLFLDKTLPKDDFYYEKTEISEIAPRPKTFTRDLLDHLYKASGPIDKVYSKYNISYQPRDIFQIIGNELFIDREEELRTLLPAYSYLKSKDANPKISSFSGLFKSFGNILRLQKISPKSHDELFEKLKAAFSKDESIDSIGDFQKVFMEDYETIFEINLLTGITIKKLETLVGSADLPMLLTYGQQLLDNYNEPNINIDSSGFTCNTIDVADESDFKMKFHSTD